MFRNYSASILLGTLICASGLAGKPSKIKSTCEIHQARLVQEEIPVLFGKPVISEDYSHARETQFPNAHERCVFGGCEPGSSKKTKVMVCPKCSEARNLWLSKHQVKDARI